MNGQNAKLVFIVITLLPPEASQPRLFTYLLTYLLTQREAHAAPARSTRNRHTHSPVVFQTSCPFAQAPAMVQYSDLVM